MRRKINVDGMKENEDKVGDKKMKLMEEGSRE